jgi:hypothetical protein
MFTPSSKIQPREKETLNLNPAATLVSIEMDY